ncbi:hypothetical protein F4779DRAFT_626118 [Xylariaceae sp. FL0662B]|nr:hypothetical protein F4779DRAFT_626118 [Xylariaceae sp. FL0662B]
MRGFLSAIALLPVFIGVTGAVTCANVTIANSDDADEVRRDCKVISGDLMFNENVTESINLDGVETVEGRVWYTGCGEFFLHCAIPPPFSISSSTLTTINGDFEIWSFNGLQELRFPNLTLVQGHVSIGRIFQLDLVDFTKLARVGSFYLEAMNVATLRHERLEGFTRAPGGPNNAVFLSADVDSVDSFFSTPNPADRGGEPLSVYISSSGLPNVRDVTIGWSKVEYIDVTADNLGITLGATNTTSMEVDEIYLQGNITRLERGPALKNLTVGNFIFEDSIETDELDLFFDQVSTIRVAGNFKDIRVPPQALHWKDLDLYISFSRDLTLDSQYHTNKDGSREQTWYWPQEDMRRISIINVTMSNDFFESFLANANSTNATRVLDRFELVPSQKSKFDCAPFDELRDRGVLPAIYACKSVPDNSASAPAVQKSVVVIMALVAMAISLM